VAADAGPVREIVQEEWAYLVGLLPANLDSLAVATGALRRRRVVTSGEDLVRVRRAPTGGRTCASTFALCGCTRSS
jgi:hypothetical protein